MESYLVRHTCPEGSIRLVHLTFSQLLALTKGADRTDAFWDCEESIDTLNGNVKLVNEERLAAATARMGGRYA